MDPVEPAPDPLAEPPKLPRRESGNSVLFFSRFQGLDAAGRAQMLDQFVTWALGSDPVAAAQFEASDDAATGAKHLHERIKLADLAANSLFGMATEMPESRPLIRGHWAALKAGAMHRDAVARVVAAMNEDPQHSVAITADLAMRLRADPSMTSQVLTASAMAWTHGAPEVSKGLKGLLAITKSTRGAALVQTCRSLEADAYWVPFYGPLRILTAEISLPIPFIARRAASEFARAVVAFMMDGRDMFTRPALPHERAIRAFADALKDRDQATIDVASWPEFGEFGQRWAVAQLIRRILRYEPDMRALTALLALDLPDQARMFEALHDHLEWLNQYQEPPSALRLQLRALVADMGPA